MGLSLMWPLNATQRPMQISVSSWGWAFHASPASTEEDDKQLKQTTVYKKMCQVSFLIMTLRQHIRLKGSGINWSDGRFFFFQSVDMLWRRKWASVHICGCRWVYFYFWKFYTGRDKWAKQGIIMIMREAHGHFQTCSLFAPVQSGDTLHSLFGSVWFHVEKNQKWIRAYQQKPQWSEMSGGGWKKIKTGGSLLCLDNDLNKMERPPIIIIIWDHKPKNTTAAECCGKPHVASHYAKATHCPQRGTERILSTHNIPTFKTWWCHSEDKFDVLRPWHSICLIRCG